MILKRVLPSVVCIALLAACESVPKAPPAPVSVSASMEEAESAIKAGQADRGFAVLTAAAKQFPADKSPWLRMAQLRFDASNYGEAIVNGLEALERDPDDTVAYSLVAVSGLRVSSRALSDLTQKNNLSGNVRSEAQELAKLLRTSLNEDQLVPKARVPKAPVRAAAAPAAAPARPAASSNPFDSLK